MAIHVDTAKVLDTDGSSEINKVSLVALLPVIDNNLTYIRLLIPSKLCRPALVFLSLE